jgi:hypothetical protein
MYLTNLLNEGKGKINISKSCKRDASASKDLKLLPYIFPAP